MTDYVSDNAKDHPDPGQIMVRLKPFLIMVAIAFCAGYVIGAIVVPVFVAVSMKLGCS